MPIPKGMHAIISKEPYAIVNLNKCRDFWLAYSFAGRGWNPYSALVKEYQENPSVKYDQSVLKSYYEKFQPKSLQELIFSDIRLNIRPICNGWPPLPWFITTDPMRIKKNFSSIYAEEIGPRQFEKVVEIYKILSKEGYRPEKYPDGFIRGYFLKYKNDYRFHVLGGNHRIAALALLGYKDIKVKIQSSLGPRSVDIMNINNWPNVRNGMYSKALAAKIFITGFTNTGEEIAKKLGIYKSIY